MMRGITNIARLILRNKERAPGLPVMRYEAWELQVAYHRHHDDTGDGV